MISISKHVYRSNVRDLMRDKNTASSLHLLRSRDGSCAHKCQHREISQRTGQRQRIGVSCNRIFSGELSRGPPFHSHANHSDSGVPSRRRAVDISACTPPGSLSRSRKATLRAFRIPLEQLLYLPPPRTHLPHAATAE